VPDADGALAELARVTRPGGRLVVFDFDWETHFVDSPLRATGSAGGSCASSPSTGSPTSSCAARRGMPYDFYELLLGGHLVRAQEAGLLAPAEGEAWWDALRTQHEAGTFLAGLCAFIVSGTKARR
jgi:hypothetical protein